MTPPAVTVAGPTASADLASAEALRGEVQKLHHIIRHALPALRAVHDDPCEPAQRKLLGEVIDDLAEGLVPGCEMCDNVDFDDDEVIPPSCPKCGRTGDGDPMVYDSPAMVDALLQSSAAAGSHPWALDDIIAAMNGDYR